MADDSLEVQKDEVPFHPCLTPRGMTWYNLDDLTSFQQKLLTGLKFDVIKDNNRYLARHPEIRAIISILLQAILKEQPKIKSVADFAKDFFNSMTKDQLQTKIDNYLEKRGESLEIIESSLDIVANLPDARSSEEDLASLCRKDYYSWMTYTTQSSSVEEEYTPEWSSAETPETYEESGPTATICSPSFTASGTDKYGPQDNVDLLFASMASFYSGEHSIEDSTTDMTQGFFSYGAPPQSAGPTPEPDLLEEATSSSDGEIEDEVVEEEIRIAEEIEGRLSIIIENIDEEEETGEDYYDDVMDKRSIIEMDLESLRERHSSIEGEDDSYDEVYRKNSAILESLLNYEMSLGG